MVDTIFFQFCADSKRPVWFVFTGMGSQWPGMGKSLLKFPIFAAAIEKCHRFLEPHGVDLINVITSDNPKIYDNILNCFVGIAACQVIVTVLMGFSLLNAELNTICHLLALLGTQPYSPH